MDVAWDMSVDPGVIAKASKNSANRIAKIGHAAPLAMAPMLPMNMKSLSLASAVLRSCSDGVSYRSAGALWGHCLASFAFLQ
jgi:hypothetical protein